MGPAVTSRSAKGEFKRAPTPSGKPCGSKKALSALNRLTLEEQGAALRALLARHPEWLDEAEAIAGELLARVSADDVAEAVASAVVRLDYDDLNARAGDHGWGYVAPEEAADELLWEAIAVELTDMTRKAELGLYDAAFTKCQGLVLGLKRAKDMAKDDVLGWAPDFPGEAACRAATDLVRACGPDNRVVMERRLATMLDDVAPEWSRTFALSPVRASRA